MDTFNLHLHTFGTQYNTFKFIMRHCYSASHISWFLLLFFFYVFPLLTSCIFVCGLLAMWTSTWCYSLGTIQQREETTVLPGYP